MKTWLLLALNDQERIYKGNLGYADDIQSTYRYDSFVPNHSGVQTGDLVVIRGKREIHGMARIERIDILEGLKDRLRCPVCNMTKLTERKARQPRFRCACGANFDSPLKISEPCRLYAAFYGNTFSTLQTEVKIPDLWKLAPRLSKQLAILELDTDAVLAMLGNSIAKSSYPDELPVAMPAPYVEGGRTIVSVNRYERNPRARAACIEHHGRKCVVCGFDFPQTYGAAAQDIIEVHHMQPVAGRGDEREIDPVRDLRPVCPNCHTVIHTRKPPFTLEEMRVLIAGKKGTIAPG